MVRDVGHRWASRCGWRSAATPPDRSRHPGKLEARIGHLLRNAVDHGIEDAARRAAGKPEQGVVRLEARQRRHADDRGATTVAASISNICAAPSSSAACQPETAARLSEAELLEFLLLPSFSLRDTVTEISGRGVAWTWWPTCSSRCAARSASPPAGQGSRFLMQLPLTLSVIRSLLVEIAGEPYAFPLAYVNRTCACRRGLADPGRLSALQPRGRQVGLVSAHRAAEGPVARADGSVCVVVIGEAGTQLRVAVDAFLGERMLVVQPLDARLGKIPDVLAGALMEDGAPLLILDVADLLRTVEKLTASGRLQTVARTARPGRRGRPQEGAGGRRFADRARAGTQVACQSRLPGHGGGGWHGWLERGARRAFRPGHHRYRHAAHGWHRVGHLIRGAPQLQALPVMIVSYKDRKKIGKRGLAAGADHYFTKSSFHDESLLQAVTDLIGEATS
jgi:two-component system sensor histidine kinase and response regulator WspE